MQRWEYHEEVIKFGEEFEVCESAGADGWELCGMVMAAVAPSAKVVVAATGPSQKQLGLLLLFKRPLPALNGTAVVAGDAASEYVFAR